MAYSVAFDQDIVIPASMKFIGKGFMYAYKGWHRDKFINNSSVTHVDLVSYEQYIAQIVIIGTAIIVLAITILVCFVYVEVPPAYKGLCPVKCWQYTILSGGSPFLYGTVYGIPNWWPGPIPTPPPF